MKNLENIIFDRFRDFLKKHNILIKHVHNTYYSDKQYKLFFNQQIITSTGWASKNNFLLGDKENYHDIEFFDESIFQVSEKLFTYSKLDDLSLRYGEPEIADLWPILRQIQADSLEEMIVKMDLAEI